MPYFDDAQALYDGLGRVLQDAVADEELGPKLAAVDGIVQLRLRNPDSQVTLGLVAEGERGALLGPVELNADLVVGMEADTAHELFTGELNPTVALAKGRLVVKGPVAKVLRFVSLLGPLSERYQAGPPAVSEEGGADAADTAEVEGGEPQAAADTAGAAPAES
jgi:putative sterol carrier protein